MALVVMRAVSLWFAPEVAGHSHTHDREHTHRPECGHDHHHHGHDHGHAHEHGHHHHHDHDRGHAQAIKAHAGHSHSHPEHRSDAIEAHAEAHQEKQQIQVGFPGVASKEVVGHQHGHSHSHSHGHDHGHGWAPWRYGVLLLPVILYLLRLPNEGFGAGNAGPTVQMDLTKEAAKNCAFLAATSPLQQVVIGGVLLKKADKPIPIDFSALEGLSSDPGKQALWQGKTVRVKAMFQADPSNDRRFDLFLFRMQCCAADAIPVKVPCVCRESVSGIQSSPNATLWVEVTGQIDFWEPPGSGRRLTFVHVAQRSDIKLSTPRPTNYLQ
jgi:hypothetical protein